MKERLQQTRERQKQIREWRRQKPPLPWRDIADRLHVSIARAQVIFRGGQRAPNPFKQPVKYGPCAQCGEPFESTAKWPPLRCPGCGSHHWRGEEAS